jgi:hypothetical protein
MTAKAKRASPTSLEVFKAERAANGRLALFWERTRRMRAELQRFSDLLELELLITIKAELSEFRSVEAKLAYIDGHRGYLTFGQRAALERYIGATDKPRRARKGRK